jgi:quercetin dioxygenase-like cupin family protein
MMKMFVMAALAAASGVNPPLEKVTPAFNQTIPNIPGKSMIAAVVDYPPGGASPAHRHAPSAFIFAYVISGRMRSSVNGSPVRVYGPGESWSEPPGAHHSVSENASATKPARLLAVFVLDSSDRELVIPDRTGVK